MADNSSRSRARKLGLIAPLSIAGVIALVLLVSWLVAAPRRADPPAAPADQAAPPPPAAPLADPVIRRADLIASANALAAAHAAGGQAENRLAGRRFALRIPFGCEGPQLRAGAAQAYYEFDAQKRTVRLVARPAVWTSLPGIVETAGDPIEAAEGFWIPRPWTAAETCPRPRDKPLPAAPTPPAGETLGLVRLFTSAESRVGRRGERPYETLVKLGEGDTPPLFQGYKLVLEGRFTTFADGRVAHCWSESAAHRPICIYAAALDRVAFESGDSGRILAEWRD